MKILVQTGDLIKTPADLLVINLFEGVKQPGGATGAVDKALSGLLSESISDEHFEGKESQSLILHTHGKIPAKRVLVVGLGKSEDFSLESVRRAAATSLKKAKEVGAKRVASVLHGAGIGGLDPRDCAEAMAEGILLASYRFTKHKDSNDHSPELQEFTIVEKDAPKAQKASKGIEEGSIDAEAANFARDLVNEPPSQLTPTMLAGEAKKLTGPGLAVKILGRAECAKLGMGAYLGVARGSDEEPQFIHLIYRPVRKPRGKPKRVVFIGKGITFDTGGIQLKDRKGMATMKMDMAGAAAVLGVFRALSTLKPSIEVHGLIAAAENMPSGRAIKPGDILKARNGTTVEVGDTDAEGRLTLADALSYGVTLRPDAIIDLATLTGSVVAGLGEEVAGLFGNDRATNDRVKEAADSAGEMVWELPLVSDYRERIKSKIADLKNVGGREGDAINAALFLEHFVQKRPWVHLDIAGPAYAEKDFNPYTQEGGTGFGVRTLLHYLRSLA